MPTPTVPAPGMGQDLKNKLAAAQTAAAAKAAARAAIALAERRWMPDDQLDGLDDDGLAAEARLRGVDFDRPPATTRKQRIRALTAARTKE
jgi:hypothetical protein